LGGVGILPLWEENNRLQVRSREAKAPFIHPVFIDREIPRVQTRLNQLTQLGAQLTAEQKQEFMELSNQLDLLKHRRELLLGRTGDEYVVPPPSP